MLGSGSLRPDTRWLLRNPDGSIGLETRDDTTRYLIPDQLQSTMQTIDASAGGHIDASTRDRRTYVGNNPVGMIDPNGHDGCSPLVAVVSCAPGTDQNQSTGNANGGGGCHCVAQGKPVPQGGQATDGTGGSPNVPTWTERPNPDQPVAEVRQAKGRVTWDSPSLPVDQRISAELNWNAPRVVDT